MSMGYMKCIESRIVDVERVQDDAPWQSVIENVKSNEKIDKNILSDIDMIIRHIDVNVDVHAGI